MRTMTAGRSARRGPARLSRMHRPPGLALESCQAELPPPLRRQHAVPPTHLSRPRGRGRAAARDFDRDRRLRTEAVPGLDAFFVQAARFSHELRCYEGARGFVREIGDARRRADRLTQAFPHGIKSAALQRLLRVPLYPYQREGALFACRAGRCLLADEMGLGKTVQAIAAAEIMAT